MFVSLRRPLPSWSFLSLLALCALSAAAIGAEPSKATASASPAPTAVTTPAAEGVEASSSDSASANSPASVAPADTSKPTVKKGASMMAKIKQGGLIAIVLIGISIALVSFALERLNNLKRVHIVPDGFADDAKKLWKAGQFKTLRTTCEQNGSTLASIIRALVTHRTSNPLELSQLAGDIASQDMRHHMQKLIPFALIATISPLLGLLGTVSGMIDSFEVVAIAGSLGDASILADGIAKALVTTAVGLLVAVPAIALFNFFKVRTTRMALLLDGQVNQLISEWFMPEVEDEDRAGVDPAHAHQAKEST